MQKIINSWRIREKPDQLQVMRFTMKYQDNANQHNVAEVEIL